MKKRILSFVLALVMISSFAFMLVGCKPEEEGEKAESKYTYNTYTTKLVANWNPHTYTENAATLIPGYTTDAFYTFDYNEGKDGYEIVPSMAVGDPVDVTESYVGQYGIAEGDSWKAIEIELKNNLKFDNGDAITAEDFVESAKLLLNPDAYNFRADTLYLGDLQVAGAESYAKQKKYINADTKVETPSLDDIGGLDPASIMFEFFGDDGARTSTMTAGFISYGYSLPLVISNLATDTTEEMVKALNGKTLAEINADATLKGYYATFRAEIIVAAWEATTELECFTMKDELQPAIDWDTVGILAVDGKLVLILDKPLEGFMLKYNLSSTWLVHNETYKACSKTVNGLYQNSYGTSVGSWVGFGPYKLDSYVADNSLGFSRSDVWHGFTDGSQEGLYQTTNIKVTQIAETATALNMFLKGQLDSYGLQAADMEKYGASDHAYVTEGESTWYIATNPDLEALKNAENLANQKSPAVEVDKEMLSVLEFRQALSFALDRANFAAEVDPLASVATALMGNQIIADPETSLAYRDTEQAKDVLLSFWGLADQVGDGKKYATKDEAIASITGYDPTAAKELFDEAYDIGVAAGYIPSNGNFEVVILVGKPSDHPFYTNGFEFAQRVWTEAVKGTKFEGKLKLQLTETLGDDWADQLRKTNQIEMLIGVGYSGNALNPYGLVHYCYLNDEALQYNTTWDSSEHMMQITLPVGADGADVTLEGSADAFGLSLSDSVDKTFRVVTGGTVTEQTMTLNIGNLAASSKLIVLAALEQAVLETYMLMPLTTQSSAALKSVRIEYGTEEYYYGIERGGVQYMTYKLDDKAWAEYIAEKGGTLTY